MHDLTGKMANLPCLMQQIKRAWFRKKCHAIHPIHPRASHRSALLVRGGLQNISLSA